MEQDKLINDTVRFVKQTLKNAEGGHDWWHIYRVWKLSEKIAISEKADITVVVIAALLHDIADAKFNDGDDSIGPKMAADFLKSNNVQESVINHVVAIIKNISFAGGNQVQNFHSPELDIVQDADRLD